MQDTLPDVLDTIYALGHRMLDALRAHDLPAFFDLVEERSAWIDHLRSTASAPTTPVADRIEALDRQVEQITALLSDQEQRLGETLTTITRYKEARRRYDASTSGSQILNENLRG